MASALIEELKIVATEAKKTQIEDAVGSSWAALGGKGPSRERDRNSFSRSGSRRRGGGEGRGGTGTGGRGRAWGRGCWTARNPA